jgi:hypothetical protein
LSSANVQLALQDAIVNMVDAIDRCYFAICFFNIISIADVSNLDVRVVKSELSSLMLAVCDV